MKRWWVIILLLPCVVLAQQQPAAAVAARLLTVSLPRNIKPETAHIDYGFYGPGLSISQLSTRAGVFDYPLDPRSMEIASPTSLKVVIYIPGYRVVASEFTREELQAGKVFVPTLVPLPTTTFKGRLIDSAGNPMKDEVLKIGYVLGEEMNYFGYADGMVRTLNIAEARTDDNGDFAAEVPSLIDDPFFKNNWSPPGGFYLRNDKGPGFTDQTLNPRNFPIQKTYEPLTIRKTQKGTLSGTLGRQFLLQNNLSDNLREYTRRGDTIVTGIQLRAVDDKGSGFNARLYPEGTFELQVPAGKYDIELWVNAEERRIPIERGVVLEEGKRRVLERP